MYHPTSWEEGVAIGAWQGLSLEEVADKYGTPCFVYSAELLRAAGKECVDSAAGLDARLRYAVKANGNLEIMRLLDDCGLGFDVASMLEIERAIEICGNLESAVFTGPGKSMDELGRAFKRGIEEIICDSHSELDRVVQLAASAGTDVTVGVRVNPDIDAGAHPHIATGLADGKFGVSTRDALHMCERINKQSHLHMGSIGCHIGSQIDGIAPYIEAFDSLRELARDAALIGVEVARTDLGGGYGIGDTQSRPEQDLFAELCDWLRDKHPDVPVGFQPGRRLVGRAGILLTRVEYCKGPHVIVDAGMTELLRPALYDARHGVAKLGRKPATAGGGVNVVGPVCESADFLVKDVELDASPGDLLAIFDAGAYGAAMMSNYNGRLRPCEVMLEEGLARLVRPRDTVEGLLAAELNLKQGIFD